MLVKATREGLVGKTTASGFVIDRIVSFVALPSVRALGRWIKIVNPLNGKATYAQVLDVGPWNENDDRYVFGGERPMAESGVDTRGRATNRAGIDLSEAVWNHLEMKNNTQVDWEFLLL